jgi:ABC-type dipeptide/oligopeptide/nickel transport system permease component
MVRYVGRRLAWTVVVLLGIVTTTFLLSRVIPADPARLAAGIDAGPDQVAEVKRVMGLDQPVFVQFARYVAGLAHLDFGLSIQSRRPVTDDLATVLPATLELVLLSFFVYAVLGIALGILWSMRPRTLEALVIHLVSIGGVAVPVFWVALMFQLVFGTALGWLPVAGRLDSELQPPPDVTGLFTVDALLAGNLALFGSALRHLALPVAALVLHHLAVATRLTRASILEELDKPYVRSARARGLTRTKILFKHVLRNALNPVLSMLGVQFGRLLGGTLLVEIVFSWPGLGLYAFNSFRTFDYNPIIGIAIVTTIGFMLVNLLVDLLYPVLDPRIRTA